MFRACLDGMSFKWYHLIFCFHHPNRVGLTDEHLFGWVLDHCFHHSIIWFLSNELWKLKTLFKCFQFHNFVFNCISIIKTTYWVPLVLSCQLSLLSPTGHSLFSFFFFFNLFFHFSFFLSSSLSILLQSKNLILTDHSHRKAHTCRPLMPKSSYSSIYWREKSRDHRRQSSITLRKASPCAHSLRRCYCTRSSIWPKHRNRHP